MSEASRRWYRARYQRNKEAIKARIAHWQKENREKVNETRREHDRKLRSDVFELLGNKCKKCEFDDPRALQVDHVHGGGGQELRKLGHSRAIYRKVLLSGGEGYQLLCANCNTIKAKEQLYGQTLNGRTEKVT